MVIYTSQQILEAEDLYQLQESFCAFGIPFKYQLTEGEIGWLDFVLGKYEIASLIKENIDEQGIVTFNDRGLLHQALVDDGVWCASKAPMLSDDTALQKLIFWLSWKQ